MNALLLEINNLKPFTRHELLCPLVHLPQLLQHCRPLWFDTQQGAIGDDAGLKPVPLCGLVLGAGCETVWKGPWTRSSLKDG